ncbi:hypothetical protein D3C75_329930 [compost metagenome]
MQIGGLFDVLAVLRRRKHVGRGLDLANAFGTAIGVLAGELQRVQRSLVQQHEPILSSFCALFYNTQRHCAADMNLAFHLVNGIPAERGDFRQAKPGKERELKECGVNPTGPMLCLVQVIDDSVGHHAGSVGRPVLRFQRAVWQ